MFRDLMSSKRLLGRTREELVDLIGEGSAPDFAGTYTDHPKFRGWDLVFNVGCRDLAGGCLDPWGVDCSYIVVRFGDDGRCSEFEAVHQHPHR